MSTSEKDGRRVTELLEGASSHSTETQDLSSTDSTDAGQGAQGRRRLGRSFPLDYDGLLQCRVVTSLMHTASWPPNYHADGRSVADLGTGAEGQTWRECLRNGWATAASLAKYANVNIYNVSGHDGRCLLRALILAAEAQDITKLVALVFRKESKDANEVLCDQFNIRICIIEVEMTPKYSPVPMVVVMEPAGAIVSPDEMHTLWIMVRSEVGTGTVGHAQAVVPLGQVCLMDAHINTETGKLYALMPCENAGADAAAAPDAEDSCCKAEDEQGSDAALPGMTNVFHEAIKRARRLQSIPVVIICCGNVILSFTSGKYWQCLLWPFICLALCLFELRASI
ncbi:hypothetical protein WJX73_008917 [Symbiochloris irregularis]|uniref:Uncharacterized protein n=1 Tax=Symbiochloris irregularis TaxID=706552 RepID=A0AAW1P1K2_9CHLO